MGLKKNPYRLPQDITPVQYELFFEPDLGRFVFSGESTLQFDSRRPLDKVVLHAADLKVHSAELLPKGPSSPELAASKISYDERLETVTFHFPKKFPAGKGHRLRLKFSGTLNDKMHGFYRTSYWVRGKRRWGAATQFEATDARRAFPCVDEPAAKARFIATLRVAKPLTALSNMPVKKETLDARGDKKTLQYESTPVMSAYLLCFVVAELESIQGRDANGVPIGIWTTPGKKEQGRFALDVAKHALPYFSKWFDIPYALPKLDMVALPDFASGAMENWGLVTYRETALLVDEKNSSAAARQRVAEVIDHELAHQWFGNLVTMRWWTDLWLNEGFASYMGPKAVDDQFPQWKIWSQYIATEYITALHDDALKNSHPIEIPVRDPHEIREIFDHITYNKGSAVNRMLEHYLGEKVFRQGLRRYLKRFAYKNASTTDLWRVLEEVSGQPVRAIMATYTQQEGYPILSVEKKAKAKKDFLEISQSRFIFDGSRDEKKLSWKVPVTVAVQGQNKVRTALLSSRLVRVPLDATNGHWIKLNPGQSGFYRTAYSAEIFRRLIHAVQRQELSALDCMGILDDAFARTRAGSLKTSETLNLLRVCRAQTDYNLWLTVSSILGSIENIVPGNSRADYSHFAKRLFKQITTRCGWDSAKTDTHLDQLLRSLALSRSGHYGEMTTVDEAKRRFRDFTQGKPLNPNLRGAVYSIVAAHGGAEEFERLKALYRTTDLQEEKVRLLRGWTRFRTKSEIQKVLELSLMPEVRTQDAYVLLAGFGSNEAARDMNWQFVKSHWKELTQRYHSGSVGLLGHILEGSCSGFTELERYEDVKRFFAGHPVKGTERTRKQTLEVVKSSLGWKKRDGGDIERWLAHGLVG